MRLLDSDTCIQVLRGSAPFIDLFAALSPGSAFISSITYHELRYGALHSGMNRSRHLHSLDDFCSELEIFPFTEKSSRHSAAVRENLATLGTPIGPLDTLIAGHALEHELILVTGNVREFSRVQGLTIENWFE
jgi:tRNA(fMet)-specific endonuclease VapC